MRHEELKFLLRVVKSVDIKRNIPFFIAFVKVFSSKSKEHEICAVLRAREKVNHFDVTVRVPKNFILLFGFGASRVCLWSLLELNQRRKSRVCVKLYICPDRLMVHCQKITQITWKKIYGKKNN